MTLSTPWEVEQTWGSHQPVLAGVLEVLKPQTAVECGCGEFSTGRFRDAVPELTTVEHDEPWAKRMRRKFPASEAHRWSIFPLLAHNGTPVSELPPAALEGLEKFYNDLKDSWTSRDFVFVDTYRCARVIAVRALSQIARVLLLHDVRPYSWEFYKYEGIEESLKGWKQYQFRPEGYAARVHLLPWTALYSREELPLEAMQPAVLRESRRLWDQEVRLEVVDG